MLPPENDVPRTYVLALPKSSETLCDAELVAVVPPCLPNTLALIAAGPFANETAPVVALNAAVLTEMMIVAVVA